MLPLDPFDEIIVIGHDDQVLERFQVLFGRSGLSTRPAAVFKSGTDAEPPEEWKAGKATWNCLLGHVGALRRVLASGALTALIMEQDCVLAGNPEQVAASVAESGGCQYYFGGQLLHGAGDSSGVSIHPPSVHRAHCYSVVRSIIPAMIGWLTDPDNYGPLGCENPALMRALESTVGIRKLKYPHLDYLMESGHKAGEWPMKASAWWFAGQSSGTSSIRLTSRPTREVPERWWHFNPFGVRQCGLPIVVIDRNPSGDEMARLNPAVGRIPLKDLLRESFESGRFPAIQPSQSGSFHHPEIPLSLLDVRHGFLQDGALVHPSVSGMKDTAYPRPSRGDGGRLGYYQWSECQGVHDLTDGGFVRKPFRSMKYRKWDESDYASLAGNALVPELLIDNRYPERLRKVVAAAEIIRQIGGFVAIDPVRPDFRQESIPNFELNFFVSPDFGFMGCALPGNKGAANLIRAVVMKYMKDPANIFPLDLRDSASIEHYSYLGVRHGTSILGLHIVVSK